MLIKTNYSMTKPGLLIVMLMLAVLLTFSTGCTIRAYDDHVSLEPGRNNEPEQPYPSDSRLRGRSYIMKEKLFSFRDEYVIKDQDNVPVYYVMGKNFTIGNKFSFRDENGVELAYISQRVLSFMPKYKIMRNNREIATIQRKFRLGNTVFKIKIQGEPDIQVKGDFWEYNYLFTRNGRVVAEVTKKFLAWSDTYLIEVAPGEDDVLILATAVVVDMVCHGPEEHHIHHHKP